MNGWLIFIALVVGYMGLLFWLVSSGRMQKWNLSLLLGFILMIRTQKGRKLIDQISRPKRLWNAFGDFGTALSLLGMVAMFLLMLLLVAPSLDPESGIEPLGASEILVIPGVNPFVPLWYGIIALIVTLVVHEGGHGVLARAGNLRLKSLGLLYAIVPVGAFVEPDEEDLQAAPLRTRLRVYAAGATVNIVLAAALVAVFAALMGAAVPVEGVPVSAVPADQPAHMAGIAPLDVLVAADGVPLATPAAFSAYLDNKSPGDQVVFEARDGDSHTVTLGSRWDALDEASQTRILQGPEPEIVASCNAVLSRPVETRAECITALQADAFVGINIFQTEGVQGALAGPVDHIANFLFLISLPIGEVRDAPYLSTYLPAFFETPFSEDAYWITLNLVFWIFWINLMVGLTNILPMVPLDGGHIFRDAVGGIVQKLRPNMDPDRRTKIVGSAAAAISFLVLGMFLLQIFGPRIAQAFA
ncbi:MAG: site-2 protease family protein [Thermoplasmatota archaeon]